MKKLIYKIVVVFIFLFGLQGCYTLLWSPNMEFPDENNSYGTYNNYYYYDDYYNFYYYPWWFRISPPVSAGDGYERSGDMERIRNNDGGRSSSDNRVIIPGTPSRSPGNTGGGITNPGSKGDDNTGTTRSSSDDSSKNSNTRNNDSGRNTDKGRR